MTLRVAAHAGLSHPGRRRRRNEDAFVVSPPLFAVADGMGGAQAGEVASQLAVSSLEEQGQLRDRDPQAALAELVHAANRRVYEHARGEASLGMGTTMTVALVAGDGVAIGHVGDSRAYRIRGGTIEQVTQDHSLVADLVRSGQLSPEEAGSHPQRSVITRALGTEAEIEVDVVEVKSAVEDVFLLCSDGLTTMLTDGEILELVLRAGPDLELAAHQLIDEANRRGGEDNITAVLFALAAAGEPQPGGAGDSPDRSGLDETLTDLEPLAVPSGWEWTAQPAAHPGPASRDGAGSGARAARRLRRRLGLVLALTAAPLLVCAAAALFGLPRAHFVGAEEGGRLAIYQGLPWELGAGIDLYRPRYISQVRAEQLSPEERSELLDHELLSYREARERLGHYEQESLP